MITLTFLQHFPKFLTQFVVPSISKHLAMIYHQCVYDASLSLTKQNAIYKMEQTLTCNKNTKFSLKSSLSILVFGNGYNVLRARVMCFFRSKKNVIISYKELLFVKWVFFFLRSIEIRIFKGLSLKTYVTFWKEFLRISPMV